MTKADRIDMVKQIVLQIMKKHDQYELDEDGEEGLEIIGEIIVEIFDALHKNNTKRVTHSAAA